MKLTVLTDNSTYIDRYYLGEPALSIYIENGEDRILFDTGYSDVCIQNARKMGIDLNHLTAIVISHGHNDHTGGLRALLEQYDLRGTKLIAHPLAFCRRICDSLEVGSPVSLAECEDHGLVYVDGTKPVKVSENLYFLGEIPRRTSFESKRPVGERADGERRMPDYVIDDSALVCYSKTGPFVITGCSHSGICNILLQAFAQMGRDQKACGVIGGFHLFENDDVLKETIRFLKENTTGTLYPCHCVSLIAKCEIMRALPVEETAVGLQIELE